MTEKKKHHGAPKGNQYSLKGDKPATSQLQVRVTPEEKAEFQEKAKTEGLKLSEWVLKHLRSAVGK